MKGIDDAIAQFVAVLTFDTKARLIADHMNCPTNMDGAEAAAVYGRKYAKIIIYGGTRYFVDLTDGTIYASASRSAPNFNRSFGTVFTINDFYWGNYEAVAKPGTPWTMAATRMGYATAVPKTD